MRVPYSDWSVRASVRPVRKIWLKEQDNSSDIEQQPPFDDRK